jgi:PAS domain S-box-containing protein
VKSGVSSKYTRWFSAMSLIILFTVLLATGIVIWRSSLLLRERLRQDTVQNFEVVQHDTIFSLAEFVRRELFTPLYNLDIQYIDRTLRDLYQGMPVSSAKIADVTGKVLTDGKPKNLSYGMPLELDKKRLEASPVLIEHVTAGRRVTFLIGTPEYTVGYGEIIFSDQQLRRAILIQDQEITQILREYRTGLLGIALIWSCLIALLALVISVIFSRTLSLPLIRLRDAAVRLARGELGHRVDIVSHDEIGELAAAFNQMGADLQKHSSEIALINQALQAEVEERRETEQALRNSEERLVLAQKAGRVGVYDWNPVTRKGTWTGMEELFGLPAGAFGGRYQEWAGRVYPEDLSRIEAELGKLLEEHTPLIDLEYRIRHSNGTIRWIKATGEVIYTAGGAPYRIIGTAVDITDLKESQLKLVAAKEAAEAANRAKSQFLANMSHEMRTPLAGALGMVTLVLEMEMGAEERQMLEMAKRSAESLLRLISDLLDFSRLEAGVLVFEQKPFSLPATVESALEVVSIQAREKGLQLSFSLDESVPELVHGDEGRLRQVLVNLLGNSVKFTKKGEVEVRVSPFCDFQAQQRHLLLFSVRDTGIGIPAEQTDKVFGKFVQVDSTARRKYGGTGLGLALSKEIVEILGGKIWVESQVGKGSTFYFTYPLDSDVHPTQGD